MAEFSTSLVDFHCHLDLYPDFEELIAQCDRDGIYTLAVTTTPRAWPRNNELASRTRHVRAALGLHPQVVASHGSQIVLFEQLLHLTRYVGEVGLDASPAHYSSFEQQKTIFARVLRSCAVHGGKVLSVHSVRATTAVLDMVEQHLPDDRGTVILHWFSGSRAEARRAVAMGCWFSANAQMMRNERTAEIIAAEVPNERLLTETDGPFARELGRPARPSDVRRAISAIAQALNLNDEQVADLVLSNLKRVLARPTDQAAGPQAQSDRF